MATCLSKATTDLKKLLAACAVVISLAACGGGSSGVNSNDNGAGPDAPAEPEELIPEPVVSTAALSINQTDAAGISELLKYRMPAVDGSITVANAVVLIPQGDAPEGGFPVIGWGHKASGVSDLCAPSESGNLRGSSAYLNQLVENGYAVVAADFEGLGTDDAHPYLNLASGGRSILYAVNAAVAEYESLSNRYAVLGHSQGGHAALGAGELADEMNRIVLTGVAAIAPPSHVADQALALNAIVTDSSRTDADRARAAGVYLINSALLSKGVEAVNTEFNIDSIFGNNGVGLLNSLELDCIDGLISTLVLPITGALFISGSVDSIISTQAAEFPAIQQYLDDLEPGGKATEAPVFLMQGLLDEVVIPQSTVALNNLLSSVNTTPPTFTQYPSADHDTVIEQSFNDVLNFLESVFSTQQAEE